MQVQGTQCAKGSTQIHLIFLDLHQTATDPLWTATDQPWTLNPFPFRLARARASLSRAPGSGYLGPFQDPGLRSWTPGRHQEMGHHGGKCPLAAEKGQGQTE